MKLSPVHRRNRQRGSAVIVVMLLLGIILIYVAANLRALELLRRDIKLVEQKQLRRLNPPAPTNSVTLPPARSLQ